MKSGWLVFILVAVAVAALLWMGFGPKKQKMVPVKIIPAAKEIKE